MTIVRWARHGQSEANVSQTLSHRAYDPDLTDLGRRQAAALAERLVADPLPVAAIICSPMRRARQTADVVAERLGLAPTELEDLRELDVGSIDGRRDAQAWQIYHDVLAAWAAGDTGVRFPRGECGDDVVARVRRGFWTAAGLADLAGRPDAGGPLIVAHGGILQAALPELTGEPEPAAGLPTAGVATFAVDTAGLISLLDWPAAA